MPDSTVSNLIPYVHVADLDRSITFYERLGLAVADTVDHEGARVWAMLRGGEASLMLARAGAAIDPGAQAVLFYLYSRDLAGLRERLLGDGVTAGAIAHPDHMPAGEMRVMDPDGYVLLIGQLADPK